MQLPVPVSVLGCEVRVGDYIGIEKRGKFHWHKVESVTPSVNEFGALVVAWPDGIDRVYGDERLTVLRPYPNTGHAS